MHSCLVDLVFLNTPKKSGFYTSISIDITTPLDKFRHLNSTKNTNSYMLSVETGCREIDFHGCYSPMKIAFTSIYAIKNNRRKWRHYASTSCLCDVTAWIVVTSHFHVRIVNNGEMSNAESPHSWQDKKLVFTVTHTFYITFVTWP